MKPFSLMLILLLAVGCGSDSEIDRQRDDGHNWDRTKSPSAGKSIDELGNGRNQASQNAKNAFNQGRQSTRDAFNRGRQGARDAYVKGGGKRTVSKSEMEMLYKALILKVKPGMSTTQLRLILGKPTDVENFDINDKKFSIWKWEGKPTIQLGIENGVVVRGGTPGYNIRTGFKTKLPPNLKGDARLREALRRLGVRTND